MKSPAFQFYAADYLADEHVQLMSLEEEGIYIRLLAYCWREGSIPSEPKLLQRLCKGGSTEAITMVLTRFIPHPDLPSRMVHPRLEEERKKQEHWREKSAEGGRKSAASRSKSTRTQEPPPPDDEPEENEPPLNHPSNGGATLQSSSSSSTTKENHSAKAGADAPPNMIWDVGVEMLKRGGVEEREARSYLGKLAKDYSKELLAQAIASTSAQNPANPQQYLVKVLQGMRGENGTGGARNQSENSSQRTVRLLTERDYSRFSGKGEGDRDGDRQGKNRLLAARS